MMPQMEKPNGLLSMIFLLSFIGGAAMAQKVQFDVGLILDSGSLVGKMCNTSISMALEDFYESHPNYTTRVVLHRRDSHMDVVGAASAALDLIKNHQVQAILGPQKSSQSTFVSAVGTKSHVPIVSFSATSTSLIPSSTPYFIRAALNDSTQSTAIAALVSHFGWREVVPIYDDTDFGASLLPSLIDALTQVNARVPYRSVISPSASDDQILEELYKLMSMQTRVFVVHMTSSRGARLFLKAREAGMLDEGYAWIVSDGMTNLLDSLDKSVIESMQGVIGVKPYVPESKELQDFNARWKMRFQTADHASVFALWAYDAARAVATAAEKVVRDGRAGIGFSGSEVLNNSTDLETLGVSKSGAELLNAILKMGFVGLSGPFCLVDGELQSSAFEIVNVIGRGGRRIGFWTPVDGLSRRLNSTTAPVSRLGPIMWPGETWAMPRGWVVPTSGRKMRIGVPVKNGFDEFVKVQWDKETNTTTVSGYCIDIFDAVMQSLPYSVPYEYVPFVGPDRKSAGAYNDMVYQVFLHNFDAVVGDTTIIANRSQYVDFTLPYTESGVSMIVPIRAERKNAWIFLKPLTTDLWLISIAFFFYTGFVVWLIEHRINEEFRGEPSKQFGTIFYFAFSTLVYAHKEKVQSNLSRFVVIIWLFVVLILTSSYTASLTSMLTVQKLQPTITDVRELIKYGKHVGYQEVSFVVDLLKRIGFDESKLRAYDTPDDYHEALSKGSANGGVDALFDEIPYIKLFLVSHCSDYTMVGPTYKTDGFGFVFPRGSPLVSDVSRAILNVTEGDKMYGIEKKWFGDLTTCPSEDSTVSSDSLSSGSFWGLFLITGTTTTLALIVSLILYICENWGELRALVSESSLLRRLVAVSRHYDQRHPSMGRAPTFADSKHANVSPDCVVDDDNGSRIAVSVYDPRSGELPIPATDGGGTSGEVWPAHVELVIVRG